MRYGMLLDIKRCLGCNSCTVACKQKNGTPPGVFWTKIEAKEVGTYPNVRRTFKPHICMHCDNPPCVTECPTGASYKRDEDGIVMIDQSKCIRCLRCIPACPYDARSFDTEDQTYFPEKGQTPHEEATRREKTSVTKCYFCLDRVSEGDVPACVQVCPSSARIFGDLDGSVNADSVLNRPNNISSTMQGVITQQNGYQDKPEEGTDPSVYYLPM